MDNFIRENNELRALKIEYKKLIKEVNKKILYAERELFKGVRSRGKAPFTLLLGRKHIYLLILCIEKNIFGDDDSAVDLSTYDPFKQGTIKIYDMPVYVSKENDTIVEIIDNMVYYIDESDGLNVASDPLGKGFFCKAPLVDIDELVANMPEEAKVRPAGKVSNNTNI